jgi:hypothetical protein
MGSQKGETMKDGVEVIRENALALRSGVTNQDKQLIADTFEVIAMEIEALNKLRQGEAGKRARQEDERG